MASKIITYLRPDKSKLILFALLWLITMAGAMQAWVFSPPDTPKPPGYDILNHFPITLAWPVSVMILMPLLLLSSPLMNQGIDVTDPATWYGMMVVSVYLYLVASICIGIFSRARFGSQTHAE